MCFQNYSKRSFQWNWSHFSIFIQIEMTEETRWHVKKAKCQISSKRPFSVKNHKEAIKKNFPNGFFSLMAQSTQEGVYFWDPVTKFFEIFFKVVPGSKMACMCYFLFWGVTRVFGNNDQEINSTNILYVENKSNRTTMRPLCIYLIGISIYVLNMIHFLMILADFGVFSLMVTDGRTYGHTDGRTYGHTDGQTLI